MSNYEIRLANATDLRKVLRLSLATNRQTAADLETQVTAFIQYARAMNLELSRLWLCTEDTAQIAGGACLESPGRTAMLFIAESGATRTTPEITTSIVRQIIHEETERGLTLLQCLLHVSDNANAAILTDCGFHDLAELLYLEWQANPLHPDSAIAPCPADDTAEFEWLTYGPQTHDAFADVISASYIDSLDCPGLLGLRGIDDVIEGHKAAGRFDPELWFLVRVRGEFAGCILFVENPIRPAFELVYLGVRPAFRRCGIGRLLVQRGLSEATRRDCTAMTVAVDADNTPALLLYTDVGFRPTTSRRAFILPLFTTFRRT